MKNEWKIRNLQRSPEITYKSAQVIKYQKYKHKTTNQKFLWQKTKHARAGVWGVRSPAGTILIWFKLEMKLGHNWIECHQIKPINSIHRHFYDLILHSEPSGKIDDWPASVGCPLEFSPAETFAATKRVGSNRPKWSWWLFAIGTEGGGSNIDNEPWIHSSSSLRSSSLTSI